MIEKEKETSIKELLEIFSDPEVLAFLKEESKTKKGCPPEMIEMIEKFQARISETKNLLYEIEHLKKHSSNDTLHSLLPLLPFLSKYAKKIPRKNKRRKK